MKKAIFAIILFILFAFLMIIQSMFIEPDRLIVKHFKIDNKEFKNLKIVFISDLHSKKGSEKQLQKIVDLSKKENPTLVLLGGDYLYEAGLKNSLPVDFLAKKLSEINPPLGTYAVLGNHDQYLYGDVVAKSLRLHGINVLLNENKKLNINGKPLYIAGIEDLTTGDPNLEKALQYIPKDKYGETILLSHSPDIIEHTDNDIFLILAGHFHGGQIRLPLIGPLWTPSDYGRKYIRQTVKKDKTMMIQSFGTGMSILPLRFNCPPEIIVLEF